MADAESATAPLSSTAFAAALEAIKTRGLDKSGDVYTAAAYAIRAYIAAAAPARAEVNRIAELEAEVERLRGVVEMWKGISDGKSRVIQQLERERERDEARAECERLRGLLARASASLWGFGLDDSNPIRRDIRVALAERTEERT